MYSQNLSSFLLPLLLAVAPASSTMLDCKKLVVDGHKFNLEKLGGPHSVVTSLLDSITESHRNTTYSVDICQPLKKSSSKKTEECPNGTRACAITRLIKPETDEVERVVAIAGQLNDNGGTQFDYEASRLKTSDSNSDSQKEGVRLVMKGGRYPLNSSGRDQKAVIEFLCDKNKTGLEGEWRSEDRYDGDDKNDSKKFRLRDDDKKDDKDDKDSKDDDGDKGDKGDDGTEHQLKKDDAALIWESYGPDKNDGKTDVLRLTWHTKYACENSEDSDDGDDGPNTKSHWGFFTWFFIIVFLGTAAYLIFGSWLNYNRYGARGWDLIPHGDTLRDIPYLLKDWTRRVLNTVQGTGSRGGYSAV